MKYISKILIAFFCITLFSSCAKKDGIYKGIKRGMYDGANQSQEMKRDDPLPPVGKESPSYDQYEKDRQDMTKDNKE